MAAGIPSSTNNPFDTPTAYKSMPHFYVDLDNNKLITGSSSTQIAPTPSLYQGDKPTLEVELITRSTGVMAQYTSAASAVNVRIGALGSASVASVLSLSVVTLSATGTATVGITTPVTATALATMLGSITATATAGMNSPVTGSITANFSQVQLPSVVPVLSRNSLVSLEVPTCGNYFSTVPCVFVSDPDIFQVTQFQENQQRSTFTDIFSTAADNSWPSLYSYSTVASQGTLLLYLMGFGIGAYPTTAYPSFTTTNIDILRGSLKAYFPNAAGEYQYSYQLIKSSESLAATISPTVTKGKLELSVSNVGNNYGTVPDVFVIPSPNDYTLGTAKSVTTAIMSGRTITMTVPAHGLSTGSLIFVDSINYYGAATQPWFGVNGVWPIVSVATNTITYRIGKYACLTTVTLSLTTTGGNVYPVNLVRSLASASVACAGSGYATGSAISFSINSDSCGGNAASGVVSVSNGGQLSGITVVCPGSGFTTTSTVVSLTNYKSISGITVTSSGAGYWDTAPDVTVDSLDYVSTAPGASPAVVSSSLNGDGTISLSLVSAGYGYTATPSISITAPNSGNGIRTVAVVTSGVGYADGTFSCAVSAAPAGGSTAIVNFVKDGTSQSFSVVNSGRGYTSIPGVVVTKPDLGGQISAFTVTCKGLGYLVAPAITLTGGGGSGAAAEATIDNGSITTITITTGGTGYTSAPAATIDAAPSSVYYRKQIDLSVASVTTLLAGGSSASAYLQIEEISGSDTTVLAQVPITIQARIS